jgi:hypothetical protein
MHIAITDDHPLTLLGLHATVLDHLSDVGVIAAAPCLLPDSSKTSLRTFLIVLHLMQD